MSEERADREHNFRLSVILTRSFRLWLCRRYSEYRITTSMRLHGAYGSPRLGDLRWFFFGPAFQHEEMHDENGRLNDPKAIKALRKAYLQAVRHHTDGPSI